MMFTATPAIPIPNNANKNNFSYQSIFLPPVLRPAGRFAISDLQVYYSKWGGSVSIDFYKIFLIDNNYHFRLSVLLYQRIIDNNFQLAINRTWTYVYY